MKFSNRQIRMLKTLFETFVGGVAALIGDVIANGDLPTYAKTLIFVAVSQGATALLNTNGGSDNGNS